MEEKVIKRVEEKKAPLIRYEIWLGQYNLGQGLGDQLTQPQLAATVAATSFRGACLIHEYHLHLNHVSQQMTNGKIIEDIAYFNPWDYDFKTNTNSWTGKYFETEFAAWQTFNRKG